MEAQQPASLPTQSAPTPLAPPTGSSGSRRQAVVRMVRAWWKRPRYRAAAIVVVLLLVVGGYFIMRASEPKQAAVKLPPMAYVKITAQGFSPQSITVAANTDVVWVDQDPAPHLPAADPYPTHASLPSLTAPRALGKSQSYSYMFSSTGTYHYHDDLNPLLTGEVIVK